MATSSTHRFTVKEYYRLGEIGVLRPDDQVELLDGRVLDLPRTSPLHASVRTELSLFLIGASARRWITSVQNPIHLDDYPELRPDISLVKPVLDFYREQHPQPEHVFLLIEISQSTLDSDRSEKLPAYGRAGIPEVWLVNLVDQVVEVYREAHFTGYSSTQILRAGEQARPMAFPDVVIDVGELLRK